MLLPIYGSTAIIIFEILPVWGLTLDVRKLVPALKGLLLFAPYYNPSNSGVKENKTEHCANQ